MDLFLSATPKGWKESIVFPYAKLYAELFQKKNSFKKSNIPSARQNLKILGVVISSNIISFRFLLIFRHFQITQENRNQSIGRRKLAVTGDFFFQLSQKERF